MTDATLVIGVPPEWKGHPNWHLSAVGQLEQAGGTYLGSVTCRDGNSIVEFTMLIKPSGEISLFAENIDGVGGFADEAAIARLHPQAKKVWDEVCSQIPMPGAKQCAYHWRGWLMNSY